MVFAKKSVVNEKKKIISAWQRCIIIRTLLIQGVKKDQSYPFKKMYSPSSQSFYLKGKNVRFVKKS